MFKRVVQVLVAVFLLAVVIVPNTLISNPVPVLIAGDLTQRLGQLKAPLISNPVPVLIAGDDPGGGSGG